MASSSSSTWIRGKCIGKGSFGTVSLGFNKPTGKVFAVKSVDLNSGLPPQIQSLENEIRILRSLDYSPYVVQYLGDDTAAGRRNLHLEFLQGGTVADTAFAGKFGAEEESVVRRHTGCLVSALKHIHSRGIVHCDVKGRNVILDITGGVAKLADFGSAVRVGDSMAGIGPRGSPLWMAPEVVRGEYQGPESDVWALGCTVIEMVTGKPPWKDHGGDTLRRIGFSPELPEFPAQLSLIGRDFLEKCLNRDHTRRWTCDELLLHPFITPEMTSTFRDSSPRCVLEWDSSDFDDDEEDVIDNNTLVQSSILAEQARGRLSKLFSGGGVNWESEDWLDVRNSARDEEDESCCRSEYAELEREAAGTSSEYCETRRVELEIQTLPEYLNGGGGVTVVEGEWGGPSCQHGARERVGYLAGEGKTEEWRNLFFYCICSFLLLSRYLVTSVFCRNNNNHNMKLF